MGKRNKSLGYFVVYTFEWGKRVVDVNTVQHFIHYNTCFKKIKIKTQEKTLK